MFVYLHKVLVDFISIVKLSMHVAYHVYFLLSTIHVPMQCSLHTYMYMLHVLYLHMCTCMYMNVTFTGLQYIKELCVPQYNTVEMEVATK